MLVTLARSCRSILAGAGLRSLAGGVLACLASAAQDSGRTREYADLNLKLTLPELSEFSETANPESAKAEFTGKRGDLALRIRFALIDGGTRRLTEPEDVAELAREALWENWSDSKEQRLDLQPIETVQRPWLSGGPTPLGADPPKRPPCGWAAHAALFTGDILEPGSRTASGSVFVLAGLLLDKGYTLTMEIAPMPTAEQRKTLLDELCKSVVFDGALRDPDWTDAEATARWNEFAPPSHQMKLGKLVRTNHFIVLSNASGADRYGKKLEERYAAFQKQVAFFECDTKRLLPVFYLRTGDELRTLVKSKLDIDDPESTVDSFADEDYLVTSADSNDEFEETYDLAEQLWRNRVRANGGGRWLRKGFCELVGYPENTRTITTSQLKKRRFTPLERLLNDSAWSEQTNTEMDFGEQTSSFIEFLRASKTFGPKFPALISAVGVLPDDDPRMTEETLARVLGADLPTLEKAWIDWCAKGRK